MEKTHSKKQRGSASDKQTELIINASQGQRGINKVQYDEVIDLLGRLSQNFFQRDPDARSLSQIAKFLPEKFGYLTIAEIELAFTFAIEDIIEMPYRPQIINLEFLGKLLKSYAGFSYNVKFKPKEAEMDTIQKKLERIVEFCRMYKMLPSSSGRCFPEIIDHLIETKEISLPEGWSGPVRGNLILREKSSEHIMAWFIDLKYPGIVEYNEKNNPFYSGKRESGSLRGLGSRVKEHLGTV